MSYQGINQTYNLTMNFGIALSNIRIIFIGKSSLKSRFLYAKKYYRVVLEGNAQSLIVLSNNKRLQVMNSISVFSKFRGCYDKWKDIKERYQLKWSNADSIQVFQNLSNQENNYSSMIKWIKQTSLQLPKNYANILTYCTLTGLRPTEAINSINFIKTDLDNYFDKDKMILEHLKYPEIFIRRTIKAYISIVNDSIIQIAKDTIEKISYNSLRCYFKRRNITFNFNYCRKSFCNIFTK